MSRIRMFYAAAMLILAALTVFIAFRTLGRTPEPEPVSFVWELNNGHEHGIIVTAQANTTVHIRYYPQSSGARYFDLGISYLPNESVDIATSTPEEIERFSRYLSTSASSDIQWHPKLTGQYLVHVYPVPAYEGDFSLSGGYQFRGSTDFEALK